MKALLISIATSALFMASLPAFAQKSKKSNVKTETEAAPQEKKKTGFGLVVNSQDEKIEMTRAELGAAVFTIFSYDSKADSGVKVKEFKIKFPEQRAYTVTGNTLNDEARKFLDSSRKGDEIIILAAIAENPDTKVSNSILVTLKD